MNFERDCAWAGNKAAYLFNSKDQDFCLINDEEFEIWQLVQLDKKSEVIDSWQFDLDKIEELNKKLTELGLENYNNELA